MRTMLLQSHGDRASVTVEDESDAFVLSAMGETPNGQEKTQSQTLPAVISLVRFSLLILASCVIYYIKSLEPGFKPNSNLSELMADRSLFLRQGECDSFRMEPNLYSSASLHDVQRIKRPAQQISSLAFGGRGFGLMHGAKKRGGAHVSFDATKGFPGEGWSKNHSGFKIATWNTRSMTHARFNYCKSLAYDVLAVTELWRTQHKFQNRRKAFVVGEAKIDKRTGKQRYPKDKAAGVGIMLSPAAEQKVLTFGSTGERVCYVRLEGPICNLFIVSTYLPHRDRVCPSQDDTIKDIHEALKKAPPQDCIVLLGDMNEQLGANIQNRIGKWTSGAPSKNADKIIELMSMYDLYAANTHFEPKKSETVST